LRHLRDADGPLTSEQITDLWLKARGLNASPDLRVVIRTRIGAALITSRARGVLRNEGEFDGFKGWVVA
jgi:S-adenosylmethionine:diacylglycerol 3-amino-3-carboxypropyl transferase